MPLSFGFPTDKEEAALDRAEEKTQAAKKRGEFVPVAPDELKADCAEARRYRMSREADRRRAAGD